MIFPTLLAWFRRPKKPAERRWGVIVEPSPFRTAESQLLGPFTEKEAQRAARKFVRDNPYGEATWFKLNDGTPWPPKTNRDPQRRPERG